MTENKYNIMIVEDDNTIAEKIKSHLEKWAYNVYIAKDFGNVLKEVIDEVKGPIETGTTKEVQTKVDIDLSKAVAIEYSIVK